MFCSNCGAKLPGEAKFCFSCGAKVAEISDASVETATTSLTALDKGPGVTFHILDREIAFSSAITSRNEIHSVFIDYSREAAQTASEWASAEMHTIDDIFQKGMPLAVDLLHKSLELGVLMLMKRGVDNIDVSRLQEICADAVDLSSHMEYFFQKGEEIEKYADELAQKRNIQRSSRSHWQGGGFGVKGALKGALTAGAMNMGMGAFRGIGDFITNSGDRRALEKMKQMAVETPEAFSIYVTSVQVCCLRVDRGVYNVLSSRNLIEHTEFRPEEETEARFKNLYTIEWEHLSPQERRERVLSIGVDGIHTNPYCRIAYRQLYSDIPECREDILEIAKYFHVAFYINPVVRKLIKEFRPLPEDTQQVLEEKLARLAEMERSLPGGQESISKMKCALVDRCEIYRVASDVRAVKEIVGQATSAKDMTPIWKLANSGNTYAAYVLEEYYSTLCDNQIENHNAEGIRSKIAEVEALASEGNLIAQYIFQFIMVKAKCDVDHAVESIHKLANGGFPMAMAMKGFWASQQQEYCCGDASISDGIHLLELAAEKNEPIALAWLGRYYKYGECGLPKDLKKAKVLLTKGAMYEHPVAIKELGKLQS